MNVLYPSPALAKLLIALGSTPQETTLNELFHALGLGHEEYFLTRLVDADRILGDFGIEVQPKLQDAPPDATLLLRIENAGSATATDVSECIAAGETATQEFKSTYWCDLRRRSHQPDATPQQLRSDGVKHAALKTLAGLLTTGGGTLFIGVSDAGEILGLQSDLEILQESRRNVDQLINNIKTDIAHRFRDGNTVNGYVRIEAIAVGGEHVLRLQVTSRRTLSFLTTDEPGHRLYRRQDNRTVPVEIYELEEFQAWRCDYIQSDQPSREGLIKSTRS